MVVRFLALITLIFAVQSNGFRQSLDCRLQLNDDKANALHGLSESSSASYYDFLNGGQAVAGRRDSFFNYTIRRPVCGSLHIAAIYSSQACF
jgi:hypothetical protein